MAVFAWFKTEISRQTEMVFCWGVVFYGVGVWVYFALPAEPDIAFSICALMVGAILWALAFRHRKTFGLAALLPPLLLLGYTAASLSARAQNAPILTHHYYGPVYGRVIGIDRSSSHALRLTLDHVQLSRMSEEATPKRVRLSLHGQQDWLEPTPYQYIGLTGHLSAPNGPVEPGGFDFQRHAWFLRLGGVGYTRTPVLEMKPPEREWSILQIRQRISKQVSGYLKGDIGGFAAAVTTGDRSAFSQDAIAALRTSNLAHLLAISGLHMGLLAGFIFATTRVALSLWQSYALRLPVKKIAAITALIGASLYLLLSGASIATQRAFIMAAVALVAISLDRRALTLRAVAIAALIVMALRPSSLLSPGFQMSFAATTALVAAFSAMRAFPELGLSRWQKSVLALVLSSLVAGLATAPYAAAHFNQWAAYGLVANVSAVPAMGFIVIPGAVLAALLSPFGGEWIGLELMGLGLRWILFIAHWISELEGARVPVVAPQPGTLPLLTVGALLLVLWQGALRITGGVFMALALLAWFQTQRPDILITGDGKLVGVMTEQGRVLSKPRGQGFSARSWLENDGDFAEQSEAAARGVPSESGVFSARIASSTIVHLQGKRGANGFSDCRNGETIVSDQIIVAETACEIFDANRLKETGALAIWVGDNGDFLVKSVEGTRRRRLWSPPAEPVQ